MFYKRVALKNCPNIVRKAPVLQSKIVNKFFSQLSKMFFSMECFLADSLRFFSTNVKVWSAGYSPSDASILRNYLKFPNILTLKSFGNSCGNSYIHFLVIIIQFRFTCGEKKLCLNVKKSTNVLYKIVESLFNKVAGLKSATLLKRGFSTDVCRTSANGKKLNNWGHFFISKINN